MSTGFWRGIRDGATVVDLPKIGITGNGHFMFQKMNNAEIVARIENWLGVHGLNE